MIATLLRVSEQVLLYLPLACGGYVSFSLLRIPNFSFEGAFVFGAYCGATATSLLHGLHPVLLICVATLSAMIGGTLIGLCMGLIATMGKIPYLLASIITLGLCQGLHIYVLGGSLMPLTGNNPLAVGLIPTHPELPILGLLGAVLTIFFTLFLSTQLGVCLAVYGQNPAFLKHHGISTHYVVVMGIMLSNALAGLSGFFVAQSSGFIDMNSGTGLSLLCVTVLILGNVSKQELTIVKLKPYFTSSLIPITGMVLYCSIQQALLMVGCNLKYFTALQAGIVLCIMIYMRKSNNAINIHTDHLGV